MRFITLKKSAKPRSIANPTDTAKAIGAWINACYLKNIKEIFPEICVGFNSGEVADMLQEKLAEIIEHAIITWDGSQHDSHQFAEILDCADRSLFEKTLAKLLVKLNIPAAYYQAIYNTLIETTANFKLCVTTGAGTQKIVRNVVSSKIFGTVFSGHATRTTLGNSLRVVLYAEFIMSRANIPRDAYRLFVAGDDVALILSRAFLKRFRTEFFKIYIDGNQPGFDTKTEVRHGLGQVSKDYCDSRRHADFLSKNIIIHQKEVIFNRKITRAIQSGNYTEKLGAYYTAAQHNQNITDQLMSWGQSYPGLGAYLKLRAARLPMEPMSDKHKAMLSKMSSYKYYEERYKLMAHKNHYNYDEEAIFKVAEALGPVIYLLESDAEHIPDYLHMLKNN